MTLNRIRTMLAPSRKAAALPARGPAMISRLVFGCGLVFACVLIGFMVAVLPYWFIIAAAVVPIFFLLVAWRLEYGVLAVLALVSGIVHEAFLPSFSFLRAGDLAFFAVATISIASARKLSKGFQPGELKLWIPFTAFLALVPVSVVHAYFFEGVPPKDVLGEGRHLMFLLIFPLSVAVLDTKERVRRFVVGLLTLGVLFSLGQIVQGVFHVRIFGDAGRLVVAQTLDVKSYDATISNTGGLNIIILVMFTAAGWYVLKEIRTFRFLSLLALSAVGILLTFGRTTWGAALLGMAVVVYLLGLRKSWPMLLWSLLGATLAFAMLIAVKPAMLDALVARATSVEKEIEYGSSAAWRYYEAEQILPQIGAHPVLGLGLGAAYRRPAPSDALPEQVRYIHNGYLFVASKMGLPALSLLLWCLGVVFVWSWRGARTEPDPEFRGVHAAVCAGVLGVLLASITEPHLMRDSSLAYLGVLAGLTLALLRQAGLSARAEKAATATASAGAVPLRLVAGTKRV